MFGRAEWAAKDELFLAGNPLDGRIFNVAKFSAGYFRTLPVSDHLALDAGVIASQYVLPSSLTPSYGSHPFSFMLFGRAKID